MKSKQFWLMNTQAGIVGTTIAVVILVVAAIAVFLLFTQIYTKEATPAPQTIEQIQTQNSSDELEAIEGDLEATDLDNIDAEIVDIEAELDAALSQ